MSSTTSTPSIDDVLRMIYDSKVSDAEVFDFIKTSSSYTVSVYEELFFCACMMGRTRLMCNIHSFQPKINITGQEQRALMHICSGGTVDTLHALVAIGRKHYTDQQRHGDPIGYKFGGFKLDYDFNVAFYTALRAVNVQVAQALYPHLGIDLSSQSIDETLEQVSKQADPTAFAAIKQWIEIERGYIIVL